MSRGGGCGITVGNLQCFEPLISEIAEKQLDPLQAVTVITVEMVEKAAGSAASAMEENYFRPLNMA
ncbi:hypothetical protein [Paenibacillus sp. MER TA 81-3]|uniref:hypothetical protein n=1 Tax=Paenibacillus sp. MER TA 81-3 TaxID=2939573 RepID=UPI00203ABC6B|nr:hypothetical protein [Paenibacillus sp. MER TA 81-3]